MKKTDGEIREMERELVYYEAGSMIPKIRAHKHLFRLDYIRGTKKSYVCAICGKTK